MTDALRTRLAELLAQEPRPTGAELYDILTSEGHKIQSRTTPYRWLRKGIPARCHPPDVEATRAVIRARAKQLDLLDGDNVRLRQGAFVAIARQAEAEGRGISRVRVSQAWNEGIVDLAGWRLSAPFAVNPGGGGESEKKDTARPCHP